MKTLILLFSLTISATAQAFTLACSDCSNLEGWDTDELAFELNADDCPGDIRNDIIEAFKVWNNVSTANIKLVLGEDTTDDAATVIDRVDDNPTAHAPVIICDPDFQNTFSLSDAEADGVLGISSFHTVTNLDIKTAYLVLNAQDGSGGDIHGKTNTQRQIVIAHEIGHTLGLGHTSETSALMFFSIGSKANLNLHQDDADGLTYLYPRSEPADGLYGCGLITSQGGGSPPPPSPFYVLMLLPVFLWLALTGRGQLSITKT